MAETLDEKRSNALAKLKLENLDEAIAFVNALDENGDGKLDPQELVNASLDRDKNSFDKVTQGHAQVPFDEVIETMTYMQYKQNGFRKCLLYLVFLGIYIGILLCMPINNTSKMISEMYNWVDSQNWGESGDANDGMGDITDSSDFWKWFDQVIVEKIWHDDKDGLFLGFNNVVNGVMLWQSRTDATYPCSSKMESSFRICPQWNDPDSTSDVGVNSTLGAMMPGTTLYKQGDYQKMIYEYLPLYTVNGAEKSPKDASVISDRVKELSERGWLDGSTKDVTVAIMLYNTNTKLEALLQLRFLVQETGGIDYDIVSWAGVMDSLSSDIVEAHGAPWEFRVTLEVLFCIAILIMAVKEVLKLVVSIQTSIAVEAKVRKMSCCKTIAAMLGGVYDYIFQFWNLVDIAMLTLSIIVIVLTSQRYIVSGEYINFIHTTFQGAGAPAYQVAELNTYVMNVANICSILEVVNASNLMVAFFRLFKYFKFHPRLGQVSATIAYALNDISHFMVVMLLLCTGYAMVGHVLFANRSEGFRTFTGSFGKVGEMITLGIEYETLRGMFPSQNFAWWATAPIVMFYYGFMFIVFLLMLNFLMAIILDAYTEVKGSIDTDESVWTDLWYSFSRMCKHQMKSHKLRQVLPEMADENGLVDPTQADRLRPSYSVILHEMKLIKNMIRDSLDHHKEDGDVIQVIPYESIVSATIGNLIVEFDFENLRSAFSDPVSVYLWAKYGPGSVLHDSIAITDNKEECHKSCKCADLQKQVESMDHKLNAILLALKSKEGASDARLMAQEALSGDMFSKIVVKEHVETLSRSELLFSSTMEQLLNTYDNNVPLQAVKNACVAEGIDWNVAKTMRRGMRIIQVKKTVDKQTVRIWQRVSEDKLQKIYAINNET